MQSPPQITFSTEPIRAYLNVEIFSDLTALKIILEQSKALEYENKKYYINNNGLTTEINSPPVDFLTQREINKCFKSMIGSFQDYLDKILSVEDLCSEKINLTFSSGITMEKAQQFLKEKFDEILKRNSEDVSLKADQKVKKLLTNPGNKKFKEAAISYFQIRNGIEHHKGFAKSERVVKYSRLKFTSTTGRKIEIPGSLEEGEGLMVGVEDQEIHFNKGEILSLTLEQLENIALSIIFFVAPVIEQEVVEKINKSMIQSAQ